MQNANYSNGPTLLNKKSFNDCFYHKCQTLTNNQKVRLPSILDRMLTWWSGSGAHSLGNFHNFSIKMKHFEAYLDLNFYS